MTFPDLRSYVAELERTGQLLRVAAEVDARLEVSEIVQRLVRQEGPAVLFERVRGAAFPLVMNLFGSRRRIELALGRHPEEIGRELIAAVQGLNPPSLGALWRTRGVLARARFMRPRVVRAAAVQEVIEAPALTRFPNVTGWPRDGGPFITFGPTLTEAPGSRRRNFGLYRLQVFDDRTTGMHWQSMKGGRGHHYEAERLGQALKTAVVLGGDPILMLSAILPLPEDMDELAFAGFLRGSPTRMVRAASMDMLVPAGAEFVLEGEVAPGERRMEGPFGDHFGHYSEAAEFPVFHVRRVTRRRAPLYPASVVGKPPQEDKYMGIAAGEMIGPLIRVINPNVVDLYAYDDAGFHNLLAVALKERHPKEVLKTALALLGTGQLALTKVAVMLREDVPVRSFPALLRELWYRFEPEERMILLPIGALDTLDYTSYVMHVGSKLILDAAGDPVTDQPPPRAVADPAGFDRRVTGHRLLDGGFLVVAVRAEPRLVLEGLVRWEGLGSVKFVVAVSEDVDLASESGLVWGIFTRFDPVRDMIFARQAFVGARPVYGGRIGIDATWKAGYPLPLTMPDEIVRLVDRRWGEYFPGGLR
ncbi:MAG TPA: UbiD family decarboxylase [Gemmatimonadales bacterium]